MRRSHWSSLPTFADSLLSFRGQPPSPSRCAAARGLATSVATLRPFKTHQRDSVELDGCVPTSHRHAPVSQSRERRSTLLQQLQDHVLGARELQELIHAICVSLSEAPHDRRLELQQMQLLMQSCEELANLQAQIELVQSARAIAQLAKKRHLHGLLVQTRILTYVEIGRLEPNQLSSLAWCLAGAQAGSAPLLGQIAEAGAAQLACLSTFNVSNIAWALAKSGQQLSSHSVHFLEAVSSEARLEEFAASDLSGLSWAFATAAVRPQAHFRDRLFVQISTRLTELTDVQFVNLCWAVAGMKLTENAMLSKLVSTMQHRIQERPGRFQARDISVLAWAFAKLLQSHCLPDILTASATVVKDFGPKNLCNLLWAAAKASMGLESSRRTHVIESLAFQALKQFKAFKAQDLASFAWAMASLQAKLCALLPAADEAAAKIDTFKPRDMASFAWALASLQAKKHPFMDAAARQSQIVLSEFSGRDVANLTWAFAVVHSDEVSWSGRTWFSSLVTQGIAKGLTVQGLSNLAWACATVSVDDSLCPRLADAAASFQHHLGLRDVASLVWAIVMLKGREAHLDRLLDCSCELLRECRHLHSQHDVGHNRRTEDASSTLTLMWAVRFSHIWRPGLVGWGRECLQAIGRQFDRLSSEKKSLVQVPAEWATLSGRSEEMSEPFILQDAADVLAVYKPCGWEVDQGSSVGEKRLSTYVRSQIVTRRFCILKDATHLHGFLHRLDVPSSGLILLAKTYQAFYYLMSQLHLNQLVRDYVVCCHGWVSPSTRQIMARVLWSASAGSALPSKALSKDLMGGKPSVTHVKVLAHLMRDQQPHSLLVIRIQTGRRHQIRAHLAFIGHPVICDAKYGKPAGKATQRDARKITSSETCMQGSDDYKSFDDRAWCPRNFLHRYRLEYSDGLGVREVLAPLPGDLQGALRHLSVRKDQGRNRWRMSLKHLRGWQTGEAMQDWEQLPALDSTDAA